MGGTFCHGGEDRMGGIPHFVRDANLGSNLSFHQNKNTRASSRFFVLAERTGFEPAELSLSGFQDQCHQPLGHLSVPIIISSYLETSKPSHLCYNNSNNYILILKELK